MFSELENHLAQLASEPLTTTAEVEAFRLKYLAKKGIVPALLEAFRDVPKEHKREYGQRINTLKQKAEELWDNARNTLGSGLSENQKGMDLTAPGFPYAVGSRHPVALVRQRILDIFDRIGFTVQEEREIEDDLHNFSALNFPPDHPARDMQDTFFVRKNPDFALRTHTSSIQVRMMQSQAPPIRVVCPGRVFRNEAISARAHCMFHQVEGLYIDKNVSFADLKDTLLYYAREFFGPEAKIRLRPSYFPFTEPSAEMDVYWGLKTEADHRITKGTGWLEVLGCGMVDPNVLKACDIDPEVYSGFAFGMGIERTAMLQYGVNDLRLFFENDVRFLEQFQGAH